MGDASTDSGGERWAERTMTLIGLERIGRGQEFFTYFYTDPVLAFRDDFVITMDLPPSSADLNLRSLAKVVSASAR